jgi:hypothetical protein
MACFKRACLICRKTFLSANDQQSVCPRCRLPQQEGQRREKNWHEWQLPNYWQRFLATFRLSMRAVCEQSKGFRDYHDYPDSAGGEPWHMVSLRCKRCGKEFTI